MAPRERGDRHTGRLGEGVVALAPGQKDLHALGILSELHTREDARSRWDWVDWAHRTLPSGLRKRRCIKLVRLAESRHRDEQRKPAVKTRLVLVGPHDDTASFELTRFPVILGRGPESDVCLNHPSVSRKHAQIDLCEDRLLIKDLGSSFGTFINNKRTSSSLLSDGDILRLGSCELAIQSGESVQIVEQERKTSISHSILPEELATGSVEKGTLGTESAATDAVLGFFQQVGRILDSAFELDEILRRILDLTFEVVQAESGFVLLVDPDTGQFQIRAQKFSDTEADRGQTATKLSATILRYAAEQGRAVLTDDAAVDHRFGRAQSIIDLEIRSAICVPLKGRERILGAIYVDSRRLSRALTVSDLKLLTAVGAAMGMAVDNARLHETQVRTEKLAAMGQAVASLGHCVKNILNGMEGGSYILEKGIGKNDIPSMQKGWDILKRNSSRLKDLMLDMLAYSKPREPVYEQVDGASVPEEVVELLQQKARLKGVDLRLTPDVELGDVVLDAKAIYRALLNLVTNAIEASSEGEGRVEIGTRLLAGGKEFQIVVRDNGRGIADEDLRKLGRAFFSTKGAEGTGLGLPVVYKVVSEHGGNLEVTSKLGEGTTVTLTLPVEGRESEAKDDSTSVTGRIHHDGD
jgi:signal transduction histidine kinase